MVAGEGWWKVCVWLLKEDAIVMKGMKIVKCIRADVISQITIKLKVFTRFFRGGRRKNR